MAEGKKGGALRIIIVLIVVLLILIIGAGAMIRFDVFGLGSNVVGPVIKDVPVLNMILPEMPEEVEGDGIEAYNFETMEEAVEILKLTEKMLKESGEEAEKLSEQLNQLTAEVERLKVFENNQLQFEEDKADFDALVATTPEGIVYKDWFEKMYPENAARIYEQVAGEVAISEEMKGVINIYEDMKADEAATILESLAVTKLDQVTTIIKALSSEQAAKILGAMDASTAGKITTYMSPQ